MPGPLEYRVERGVAWVTLRNPPVNAINHAMRVELLDAVTRANGDASLHALVLTGANHTFVAGADLKEFGQLPHPPLLNDVLNALEASRVPTLAFIEGHALGGGLEIAMACHARLATATSTLGLPEVKLGLVPGAGGTQRLPRLIGAPAALDVITSGRSVDGTVGRSLGLIDAVIEPASLPETVERLVARGEWRKTRDRSERLVGTDHSMFEALLRAKASDWAGQLAPFKIVQLVQLACTLPFDEGLRLEREAFLECRASPQHQALSYLFFAEREAAKLVPPPEAKLRLDEIVVLDSGPTAAKLVNWFDKAGVAVHLVQRVPTNSTLVVVGPVPQPSVIGVEVHDQLVELVAPDESDFLSALAALISVARRAGKVAVVTRRTHDFVCKRLCKVTDPRELAEHGAQLVADGVLARASDLDVLVVAGCAFPRHLGGPMYQRSLNSPR